MDICQIFLLDLKYFSRRSQKRFIKNTALKDATIIYFLPEIITGS